MLICLQDWNGLIGNNFQKCQLVIIIKFENEKMKGHWINYFYSIIEKKFSWWWKRTLKKFSINGWEFHHYLHTYFLISFFAGGVSANSELFVAREILPQNSSQNGIITKHWLIPCIQEENLITLLDLKRIKTQFIGGLNLEDSYGTITFPPFGRRSTAGQILVEIDPIRYRFIISPTFHSNPQY